MYHTIEEFLTDLQGESERTFKVLSALSDESLNQKVYDQGRTLGFIAWHIVTTIPEMMGKTGLEIHAVKEDAPQPASANVIADSYKKAADELIQGIKSKWNDSMLHDDLNLYGQIWKRHAVMTSLLAHEIHHRAQMTVLMRQAGLKVPGVYGPSKEEWTQYGMPEMP